MLLHSEKNLKPRDGWCYEPKFDGMRTIAIISDGSCRLFSRTGRDITRTFPELSMNLAKQTGNRILDAEIIVVDESGRPDFEGLQARWLLSNEKDVRAAQAKLPAAMYVFDVMHNRGYNLQKCKFVDRKEILHDQITVQENIKVVSSFDDGPALLEACRQQKLEGIVAKRNDSFYFEGTRTKDWIKVKFTETENFVVVGYKTDDGFLLRRPADDEDSIVGSVRYGFSEVNYKMLVANLKPLTYLPKILRDDVVWFAPTVLIEVEFMQWTKSGRLRFPVFKKIVKNNFCIRK